MDPLHQFLIHKIIPLSLWGIDLSLTNASLSMILAVAILCGFLFSISRSFSLIPSRAQAFFEQAYLFIEDMVSSTCGVQGKVYFPYIFSMFLFIVAGNLLGLIPHVFTYTSQILVTFSLSLIVFLGVTILGLIRHRGKFFRLFLPKTVPLYVAPLLVPVEIISYCFRPISLSVRLCANMIAGHIVLEIFAEFCRMLSRWPLGIPFIFVPLAVHTLLMFFELCVCCLQAYVFSILTCIYLKDALELH